MTESDTNIVQIENNGEVQDVTIDQLLGFDLQGVEEVRGFPLAPQGVYEWRLTSWSNKTVTWTPKNEDERESMVLECLLEAISCRQTKDPDIDLATLVGLQYTEGFFLSAAEDLGRVKAFFVDIGMTGAGTVATLCDQSIGREFVAPITHRKDKNDTSKMYANLDRSAIEPLGGTELPPAPVTAELPLAKAATETNTLQVKTPDVKPEAKPAGQPAPLTL